MPVFTVGLDPVSCCVSFLFFPSPNRFCSLSDAPINLETEPLAQVEGGGPYLAWSGAPRCTPCRCPSSPELSKHRHVFGFFLPTQTVFFALLFNVTLEGPAGGRRKSHPCSDLPVWSAPPCTGVRPFQGRWCFSGPQTLKNKTERNCRMKLLILDTEFYTIK